VAPLGAEYIWEGADVELGGVAAGGGAGPAPVAAADGLVRRQKAGDRLGDAAAGGAAVAGRAQPAVEAVDVAQINPGVGPIQPGDPRQRLGRGGRQTFLLVLPPAVRVVEDRGRILEDAGELGELQVVGCGEPGDVVEGVFAWDRGDGARQRPGRLPARDSGPRAPRRGQRTPSKRRHGYRREDHAADRGQPRPGTAAGRRAPVPGARVCAAARKPRAVDLAAVARSRWNITDPRRSPRRCGAEHPVDVVLAGHLRSGAYCTAKAAEWSLAGSCPGCTSIVLVAVGTAAPG
jgi:hypothetical protein